MQAGISRQRSEIANIKPKVDQNRERVIRLENKNLVHDQEIYNFREEINTVDSDISTLKGFVDKHRSEFSEIISYLSSFNMVEVFTPDLAYATKKISKNDRSVSYQLVGKREGFCFLSGLRGRFDQPDDHIYLSVDAQDIWQLRVEYKANYSQQWIAAEVVCLRYGKLPNFPP